MALVGTPPAQAQARDPKLPPVPEYRIAENGFAPYQWGFTTPEAAGSFVEAWHLTLSWGWGGPPFHCPAAAERFTTADFVAETPRSGWSKQTVLRPITRQWAGCTAFDSGGTCVAVGCVTDPTTHHYGMRAICANGAMIFETAGGAPRCECPSGQELERNAAGEWRCAYPCTASIFTASCYRDDGSCPAANPVLAGIAAKVQTEIDYEGAGAHPLSFTRSFRSHGARPFVEPGAWSHWVHNWARRIDVNPEPGYRGRAFVIRDDASQRIYWSGGSGTWLAQTSGDRNSLTEQRDVTGARTGFQYKLWADDSVEHYDPTGRLLRVVQRNGWTNTLTYSDAATPASIAPRPGLLISVRNHFGRELRFTYDAAGRLAELLPPGAMSGTAPGSAASPIRYVHNEPTGLGSGVPALNQPTSVVWQDGHVRRYHYENTQFPQWLTGRTDEQGVRIGSYTYNTSGQLVRSAGPNGLNVVDFAYGGNTTQVTDHSGAAPVTSVYTYEAVAGAVRPVSVSAPCSQCSSTSARTAYTSAGDVARRVEHDGRITFHAYDAKGRETERATYPAAYNTATTRPALNLAQRVVSTRWHSTWNLPTQVAEPQKSTAYTYGTGGRLTGESWTATTDATGAAKFGARKTGTTYATGYGYAASGFTTSAVERETPEGAPAPVETARRSYTFDALGNVQITRDGSSMVLGRAGSYDASGRLLRETDVIGYVDRTYSPRGLIVRQSTESETIDFTYDGRGKLNSVLSSNGGRFDFLYSPLGQLIDVQLNGTSIASPTVAALRSSATTAGTGTAPVPGGRAGPLPGSRGGRLILITELAKALREVIRRCHCPEGYSSIYRVVGAVEYAVIQASNAYSLQSGGYEQKLFWLNAGDADWFAANELLIDPDKKYESRFIVTSRVCNSTLRKGHPGSDVGHPFVAFGPDLLPRVNVDADLMGGIQATRLIPALPRPSP
ncbi:MAG: RHS repeat protein [Rubrivivax sp.]|nr:RHS repeat protein [Rubrivivax sp.]